MTNNSNGISFGSNLTNAQCTFQAEQLCHYITDDELDRLGESTRDFLVELTFTSGGIAAGSLIPAIAGANRFLRTDLTATGTDILSMVFCCSSLAVAIVTFMLWRSRRKNHQTLAGEIRSRPRVTVTPN